MNEQNYKVTFCEADTGIVLNQDGSRWSRESGEELNQPVFQSVEEAYSLKDLLLQKKPNGEVSIENGDGNEEIFRNDKILAQFIEERNALYRWKSLPPFIRFFKKQPVCNVFED